MNATQTISRRLVARMGPRLTTPVRYSSTVVTPKDKTLMRSIFTTGTLITAGGVTYGAARSGGRVGGRYSKKNAGLDSSKWFLEGAELDKWLARK